jgi:pimeloyl-ACP methyl ester carboxylesterase
MTRHHQKLGDAQGVHPHGAESSRNRTRRVKYPGRRRPNLRCSEARSTLVLIHPFAASPAVWHPILPMLEGTHTLVSLAIPGHAGADPVPKGFNYTVSHAVDLMEAKLDALGLAQAHLVGNSLGGWLAIELARRGRARSVVAIAPGGGWEPGSYEHRRIVRKFQVTQTLLSVGGPLAGLLARSELSRRWCLRDAIARPERVSALQAKLFIDTAWRCAIFDGVVKALPTQPLTDPFAPSCPMRLVWGERDRLLPILGYSERWRRVLPAAEWVVLKGVGHIPMYDDPHAVAECILQFTRAAAVGAETPSAVREETPGAERAAS